MKAFMLRIASGGVALAMLAAVFALVGVYVPPPAAVSHIAVAGAAGQPVANLQSSPIRVNEGSPAVFNITLSAPAEHSVAVTYSTRIGTAIAADFVAHTRQSVVFDPGDQTEQIRVDVKDDERNEADETFTIELHSASNATLGVSSALATIIDTDVPDISIWNDSYPVAEGGSVPFVLVSSVVTDLALPVQVTYATSNAELHGSVTETVEIPAYGQRFKFYKRTQDNLLDDADGTLTATISQLADTDLTISRFSAATATIWDNDNRDQGSFIGDGVIRHIIADTPDDDSFTGVETNIELSQGATSVGTVVSASNGDIPTYRASSPLDGTTHSYELPLATFHFNPTGHKVYIIFKDRAINNLRTGVDITYTMVRRKIGPDGNPVGLCGNLQPTNADGRDCHDGETLVRFIGVDEKPGLILGTSNETIAEGEAGDFTVNLTHPAEVDWRATWSYVIDGDYGVSGISAGTRGSHTFAPGQTSHTVNWTTEDDLKDEDDGIIWLIVGFDYYTRTATLPYGGKALQTVTIKDDDAEEAYLVPATVTEGRLAEIPVRLRAQYDEPVSVYLTTHSGTAESGQDFSPRPPPNNRVTIPAGSQEGVFTIQTTGDLKPESTEQFEVAITSVSAGEIGSPGSVAVSIVDDDTVPNRPSISISAASAEEGETLEFTVELSGAINEAVTVNYYTVEGSAGSAEFSAIAQAMPETLNFAARETRKTISIDTSDDDVDEPNETFLVILDNLSVNAGYTSARGIGTILDDDAPPVVTVSGGSITEGGKLVYTASISRATYFDVVVNYETYDTGAEHGNSGDALAVDGPDFTGTSGTVRFAAYTSAAQTFEVQTHDDSEQEPREFVLVDLIGITNGASLSAYEAYGSILDNEAAPTLSVAAEAVTEGNQLQFKISLSHATYLTITADYRTADGTAASEDYTSTSGTAYINPGELTYTVSVDTTDDGRHEAAETVKMELHAASGITLAESVFGEGQINDNDPAPTISIADGRVTEGDTLEFEVSLSRESYQEITAAYSTANGSATAGEDYTAKTGTVRFAPGATTATIRVATTDDDDHEQTEDLTVTLRSFTGAPVVGTAAMPLTTLSARGYLADNDDIPAVSLADAASDEGDPLNFSVTLSHKTYRRTALGLRVRDGTATAGSDYRYVPTSIVFEPGETAKTFAVSTVEDPDKEGNETLTAEIFVHSYSVSLGDGTAQGVIRDDDGAPAVSISDGQAVEGGAVEFVVSLSHVSDTAVVARYATVDETAKQGEDYRQTTGQLRIEPGDLEYRIVVNTIDGDNREQDETFAVQLRNLQAAIARDTIGQGTITDNDAKPTLSVADVAVTEGSPARFVVRLSHATYETVTFDYQTADDTAKSGEDYTAGSASGLEIAPGSLAKTVSIDTTDDSDDELAERFALEISGVSDTAAAASAGAAGAGTTGSAGTEATGSASATSATGTIRDNDAKPTITIADGTAQEGSDVEFEITLSHKTYRQVTASYRTADGTAEAAHDYTATTGSVTFEPGITSAKFSVETLDDDREEPSEQFAAQLFGISAAAGAGDVTAAGTITDNDGPPTVSVSASDASENQTAVFVVALSHRSHTPVTARYRTADGTATAGEDYQTATGQVRFAAGETRQEVPVTLIDDSDRERSEQFSLELHGISGATAGTLTATVTIADNDPLPTVSVADASATEGGELVFRVTLSHKSYENVVFSYATADGSATEPGDYASKAGNENIGAGETETTIRVATEDDTRKETAETLSLSLSNITGGVAGDVSAAGTITDNDPLPTISIADAATTEGDTAEFAVTLANPTDEVVVVKFRTRDGAASEGASGEQGGTPATPSATASEDYVPRTGELSFAVGQTERKILIATLDGANREPTETFTVELFDLSASVAAADLTATGAITDNDLRPTVSVSDAAADEGGTLVFKFSLSHPTHEQVEAHYRDVAGTAARTQDYQAASGTVEFAPGETAAEVTVATVDNTTREPEEQFALEIHSITTTATTGDSTAVGVIADDDPTPAISVADVTATEGASLRFVIGLSHATYESVSASYRTAAGTATATADYTSKHGTANFAPGATEYIVTVETAEDATHEADETLTLGLSGISAARAGQASGTGTITNDDALPTISVADATATEGGTLEFAVSLSHPTYAYVAANYRTSDGTATAPADYLGDTGWVLFDPFETSQTISIATTDGADREAGETMSLELHDIYPTATAGDTTAQGTINDNDAKPSVSISDAAALEGSTAVFAVTLSHPTYEAVTAEFATSDGGAGDNGAGDNGAGNGGATAPADYQTSQGSVRFEPGETEAEARVATVADGVTEAPEDFTVALSEISATALPGDVSATGTITDEDAKPSLSIAASQAAEGSALEFAVRLSHPTKEAVTAKFRIHDVTATASDDYTTPDAAISLEPEATQYTLSIPTVDDSSLERTESFVVELYDISSAAVSGASVAAGTITDNDEKPSISVADAAVAEGGELAFAVSLSHATYEPVSVSYRTANLTATAGQDYATATGEVVFHPGNALHQTVTVTTLDDPNHERDETLTLELVTLPATVVAGDLTAEGTITDNDSLPTLVVTDQSAVEGVPLEFSLGLSHQTYETVTVELAAQDGTATATDDYELQTRQVSFAPGEVSQSATIAITADDRHEQAETFTVTATPAGGLASQAQVTIADIDSTPAIFIADGEADEGDRLVFEVSLSTAAQSVISAKYRTVAGTATADDDYTPQTGQVTFAAGETQQQIRVPTLKHSSLEPDEQLTVELHEVTSGVTLGDIEATGSILDTDTDPVMSIADATATEGDTATFAVSLSHASYQTILASYVTVPGTAKPAAQYEHSAGILVLEPGDLTAEITVSTIDNDSRNQATSFSVALRNLAGASPPSLSATGTITDNDSRPSVSIANSSATEGGQLVFRVSLSHPTHERVAVSYRDVAGTATRSQDYQTASGTVEFATGETEAEVAIDTVADTARELEEQFSLELHSLTSAVTAGDLEAVGVIADDDPVPTISVTDVTATEGNALGFVISLSNSTYEPVSAVYRTTAGTATATADYTPENGTATLAPGVTEYAVAVATAEDLLHEADETLSLELSGISAARAGQPVGTGTISNDDARPTISVTDAVADEGGLLEFAVSLSHPTYASVAASYRTADGTATEPADYLGDTGWVLFDPFETSQTISIATTDGTDREAGETMTLELHTVSTTAATGDITAQGTINDNDAKPAVSLADASVLEGGVAVLSVTLSHPTFEPVTAEFATRDGRAGAGGATAPGDYQPAQGSVRFEAGETEAEVRVATTDDDQTEVPEGFVVELAAISATAVAGDGSATATILDNDGKPSVSLAASQSSEGDPLRFAVSLSHPTKDTVTAKFRIHDVTTTAGEDYTVPDETITFDPGATQYNLAVPTVDDSSFERAEGFIIELFDIASTATLGANVASGTITDNDDKPSIAVADATVGEGGELEFAVSLSHATYEQVSAAYRTVSLTATAGQDYATETGWVEFHPGAGLRQTVAIATLDDPDHERDETLTLELLRLPASVTAGDIAATGVITDNDNLPSLVVADHNAVEGVPLEFSLGLSHKTYEVVTVELAAQDGTATAADDYELATRQVSFAPGETSQSVTIDVKTDNQHEQAETFTVTATPSGGPVSQAQVTITDIDSTPAIFIADAEAEEGDQLTFEVSLSTAAQSTITTKYRTVAGTATADDDYTPQTGQLTFSAGETQQRVNVTTLEHGSLEPAEQLTLELHEITSGVTLADTEAVGTILDTDSDPVISLADATVTEGNAAVFKVALSHATYRTVAASYITQPGSARPTSEYEPTAGILLLEPGKLSTEITIATSDNDSHNPASEFSVELSNIAGASPQSLSATGTINDDETIPELTVVPAAAVEGDELRFTVGLNRATYQDVSFTTSFADNSATSPEDYTPRQGETFVIPAGKTAITVAVESKTDRVKEPPENFSLSITEITNAQTGTPVATPDTLNPVATLNTLNPVAALGTILDVAAEASLELSIPLSVTEGDQIRFRVDVLDGENPPEFSVAAVSITAEHGVDYTPPPTRLAVDAETGFALLVVDTIEDERQEATETFQVRISRAGPARAGVRHSVLLVSVLDDDAGADPTIDTTTPTTTTTTSPTTTTTTTTLPEETTTTTTTSTTTTIASNPVPPSGTTTTTTTPSTTTTTTTLPETTSTTTTTRPKTTSTTTATRPEITTTSTTATTLPDATTTPPDETNATTTAAAPTAAPTTTTPAPTPTIPEQPTQTAEPPATTTTPAPTTTAPEPPDTTDNIIKFKLEIPEPVPNPVIVEYEVPGTNIKKQLVMPPLTTTAVVSLDQDTHDVIAIQLDNNSQELALIKAPNQGSSSCACFCWWPLAIVVLAIALLVGMHYWYRRRLELARQPFRWGPYC